MLIERICKELMNQEIKPKILYQESDNEMLSRLTAATIETQQVFAWNRKSIFERINIEDQVKIITFKWMDFIICNVKRPKVFTVFYAVHYQALTFGGAITSVKRKLCAFLFGNILRELCDNSQIICMDEQTVRYTKEYYGYNDFFPHMLRIAVDIVDDDYVVPNRALDSNRIDILSIARAEFPFKGYLIGLLNWFDKNNDNCMSLTIITYGPDEKKVFDLVDTFDSDTRERIKIVGKTDYGNLERYYRNSNLYIGMGTTLIDASQRGIVSIPVLPYTLDLVAKKFFYEDYRILALDDDSINNFEQLLIDFKNMSFEQRKKSACESRNAVLSHYGTKSIVMQMLTIINESEYNKTNILLDIASYYYGTKY